MLHHLRCPSCFHDLELPRESEQPGRLLTCPSCGWEARMWQWTSESLKKRTGEFRVNFSLFNDDFVSLISITNLAVLSAQDTLYGIHPRTRTAIIDSFLIAYFAFQAIDLYLDMTGNLDAPMP